MKICINLLYRYGTRLICRNTLLEDVSISYIGMELVKSIDGYYSMMRINLLYRYGTTTFS